MRCLIKNAWILTCITFDTRKARLTLTFVLVDISCTIPIDTLTFIDVYEKKNEITFFFSSYTVYYQNGLIYIFVSYVVNYLTKVFERLRRKTCAKLVSPQTDQ